MMLKSKKNTKQWGRAWLDKDQREGPRYVADEEKGGVEFVVRRGMLDIAKGAGFLVNMGPRGAFIKAEGLPPGMQLFVQDIITLTVILEGRLRGFSAQGHIRFKQGETKRVVSREGEVDLNLEFCTVDDQSKHTFDHWRGYGDDARPLLGRRRRKF